jgi:hypothetical protein
MERVQVVVQLADELLDVVATRSSLSWFVGDGVAGAGMR